MDSYSLYAGQLLSFTEHFAPKGHTACAGCGVALAVRHMYKALDGAIDSFDKARWQIPWNENLLIAAQSAAENPPSLLTIAKPGGDAVLQICFDNEVPSKKVDTSALFKKLPAIAAASGCIYAATACPSHPFDLVEKVRRGYAAAGSAFIHILCPCPPAWQFEPDSTVKLGRLAVETRMFPLYEIIDGYYTITCEQKSPRPLKEYLARQARFASIKGKKAEALQNEVDAAFAALKDKTRIAMGV